MTEKKKQVMMWETKYHPATNMANNSLKQRIGASDFSGDVHLGLVRAVDYAAYMQEADVSSNCLLGLM